MNTVVNLLSENINQFNFFSKVYIFGSILNEKKPNDVDLLLIYQTYSKRIELEKNNILFLEQLIKLPIDITVLSENELIETKFLEKLNNKYKILK